MAEEQLLSGPNLFWFAAGVGVEFYFLALGVTPSGMELGANLAQQFGMVSPADATAGVEAVISTTGVETLDFAAGF